MIFNEKQRAQLRKNPLFITGFGILCLTLLISLGGSWIRPDSSPYANEQHLELRTLPPMSKATFLRVERNEEAPSNPDMMSFFIGSRTSYLDIPVDSIDYTGSTSISYKILGDNRWNEIEIADVFFSLVESKPVSQQELDALKARLPRERIIEKTFLFGTDKYGRDLLSRMMSGSYISISVGLISVFISLILGLSLGLIAGYYRGWVDKVIVWFINVIWSVPTLLLVIAITLVLGKGFWQIFIAVGLTMWVEVARIVRGQVLGIREKEFVQAGTVLGFSDSRIIMRHVLPNVINPVIVVSAANFATAILLEAGLSFLGIGAPPPQATWGKMISEHKAYLITGDAYLALIPGVAIMLLVLSFTFIGNGFRDALDERRSD